MDVLEISDNRYYVMIHDGWEHFESQVMVPDMKVEEDMTTNLLHKKPEPYTSSYFDRRMSTTPDYSVISSEFDCYRSVEGSYQTMDFLASEYPSLVDVIDIGPTYLKSIGQGGREMKVLKLTNKNSTAESKAPMFVLCGIHPRELAPPEACARFAEDMLEEYGKDADKTWILDYTEIHMVLQANPDAREDEEENMYFKRKNMRFQSCLCRNVNGGVDLNRNFPHSKWGTTLESGKCGQTYPGRSAGSEKETQAIVNHMESVLPPGTNEMDAETGAYTANSQGVLMDIHSYGRDFFWPWAYADDALSPNDVDLTAFAKKMASFTTPQYSHDNVVYPTSGDTTDWAHEAIGVAAYTVEMGTWFHENCFDFEDIDLGNVMRSLLYAARVAYAPYQLPKGPDVVSFFIEESVLTTSDTLLIIASISDSERALGYDTGDQTITQVDIFIDNHPYDSDATPDEQVTSGINFVQTTVDVEISMSGLSEGQHIVYIQAHDVDGPGPVYSKYFEITS